MARRLRMASYCIGAFAGCRACWRWPATCARRTGARASREPVGLAPDPATTREAVVQVYAARTIGWRGMFGVHTWVAVKPAGAQDYTVYEVIGWRLRIERLRGGRSATARRTRAGSARRPN